VAQFDVRTPSVFNEAANLSGGNQQKVIVAREFSRPIKLLVAAQPTRGLDVGSIEYIHRRIVEKRTRVRR
jgi:simple sugar transport system ATP-binding protein